MIHHDAPLCQDFLKIAARHRLADVAKDSVKNDRPWKLNILEVDHLKCLHRPTLVVTSSPCHIQKPEKARSLRQNLAALLAGAGAVYFTKQQLDNANFNDAIGLIRNDTRAFWCERAGGATPIQDATGAYFCPVRMPRYQGGEEGG